MRAASQCGNSHPPRAGTNRVRGEGAGWVAETGGGQLCPCTTNALQFFARFRFRSRTTTMSSVSSRPAASASGSASRPSDSGESARRGMAPRTMSAADHARIRLARPHAGVQQAADRAVRECVHLSALFRGKVRVHWS